jgi:hypothetical protein
MQCLSPRSEACAQIDDDPSFHAAPAREACAQIDGDAGARGRMIILPMAPRHAIAHAELRQAMRMSEAQGAALAFFYSAGFRRTWPRACTHGKGSEEYFGFWGFTPSQHVRDLLLTLVRFVFKTRIIHAANTNATQFECVCVVESTTAAALRALCEKSAGPATPSATEEALGWLLELFNMSADVLRFDKLLSAQMVSSIDRLQQLDMPAFGNLMHSANAHFYELYRFKRAVRDDSVSARMLTGYELCSDSLCRLVRLLKISEGRGHSLQTSLSHANTCLRALQAELRAAQAREVEARQSEASRMDAARLILAFKHIGDIPDAVAARLLQALRFRAVSVDELVRTSAGRSAAACGPQEVLVPAALLPAALLPAAPAPEHVRILQRAPPGPAAPDHHHHHRPELHARCVAPEAGRPSGAEAAAEVEVTVAT